MIVRDAIKNGIIAHLPECNVEEIFPQHIVLGSRRGGFIKVECNHIIIRSETHTHRRFLEQCGVRFQSDSPHAFPMLTENYETEVQGLYLIGALAGYPLIKHCLNHGYDVIEYIMGNITPRADELPLRALLDGANVEITSAEFTEWVRDSIPYYHSLTELQLRELLLQARLRRVRPQEAIFRTGEPGYSVYSILEGRVRIEIEFKSVELQVGESFGEMALIAGQRRQGAAVSVTAALLLEFDRNTLLRLLRTFPEIRRIFEANIGFGIQDFEPSELPEDFAAPVETIAPHLFISYSHSDQSAAIRLVTALEKERFACWISSRDVFQNYMDEIVLAIKTAVAIIVIFSAMANQSEEIKKEMSLASCYKIPKIPLRIQNVAPEGGFEYEFATSQYIDCFEDWRTAIERLIVD